MFLYDFVRQKSFAENSVGQYLAVERVLSDVFLLHHARGHVATFGIEHAAVARFGSLEILDRDLKAQFTGGQQRATMKTLIGRGRIPVFIGQNVHVGPKGF